MNSLGTKLGFSKSILTQSNLDAKYIKKYKAENIQTCWASLSFINDNLLRSFMHLPLLYHFRVMSFSNIYTINAWLLLAPSSLCCDWSLGSVPLVTSIADIRNVWSTVLYTGLLTLVVHALRPKRYIISLAPRPTWFFCSSVCIEYTRRQRSVKNSSASVYHTERKLKNKKRERG